MKKVVFISTILLTTFVHDSFAQAGKLDSTFGLNGVSNCFVNGGASAVVVQNDGKIILAGGSGSNDFALARFNINGTLDSTFGTNGTKSTILGIGSNAPSDVAIQSDGKILEAGLCLDNTGKASFGLVRFNTNGTIDNTFGNNGVVITFFNSMGYADYGRAVIVQTDGKIIEVGMGQTDLAIQGFAVARFNSDGSLDNTFGIGGKVVTPIGNIYPSATCVVSQPDGKIVVGGLSSSGGAPVCFALIRYNTNGSLDNNFGTGGKVTTYFGAGGSNGDDYDDDEGYDIAIQSDGKIVMTGHSFLGSYTYSGIPIVRYNTDGSLDNSFGIAGKLTTRNDSFGYTARSIAIQQDNKILVAGSAIYGFTEYYNRFLLIRYNTNGLIDSSFGTNGMVTTLLDTLGPPYGGANILAIALQTDTKIVAAGNSYSGFTVARYISGLDVGLLNLSSGNLPVFLYPNPIQTEAILQYFLANEECLNISLFNMLGSKVQTFITNETRNAGEHKEVLYLNESLPGGNYILSISNGVHSQSIKIVKQ